MSISFQKLLVAMDSFFMLVTVLLFPISGRGACVVLHGDNCSEPTTVQQMSMTDFSHAIYTQTNSLYPGWTYSGKSLTDIPVEFKDIQKEHFSGNFNCPVRSDNKIKKSQKKILHHQLKHNINQLALCPWKFVKNVDDNRKPEILMEAVCACKFPASAHPGMLCENVYQHVTVFRRTGCDVGEYSYEKVSEKISVGCVTVALPRSKAVMMEDTQSHMGEK